jgi:RNA polymerase sigma factor (sigma-70 family)
LGANYPLKFTKTTKYLRILSNKAVAFNPIIMTTIDINELQESWTYWYPRVYSYFYKRVDHQSIVEDLTAETLNAVFLAEVEITHLPAYLWKVAHNYLVKYIKTKSTTPIFVSIDDDIDAWCPTEHEAEITVERAGFADRKAKLVDCIYHSPIGDLERKIMFESVIQDKNSTEIGQINGLKPVTVRQKLKRTLEKVRKQCLYLWK